MKRFYYFIIIVLCILTSQYTYAQTSDYSIIGYTISNNEYIITITNNEFVIKDIHDNSDKKIKSANIRMTSDAPNKHRCITIKEVNLENKNSYVIGELCKFFMNEDGTIEIFYKENKVNKKITLQTAKRYAIH